MTTTVRGMAVVLLAGGLQPLAHLAGPKSLPSCWPMVVAISCGREAARPAASGGWVPTSAPASAPASRLNPQVLALGDNAWLRMKPPREPDGRNYSCPCWGDWGAGGRAWYFGGAHFSYQYNDVDFYDLAANTWTRSWQDREARPAQDFSGQQKGAGTVYSLRTGRLWPVHTYQQVCWVPGQKVFFYTGLPGTWDFDPAAMKWRSLAGPYSEGQKFAPRSTIAWQTHHCFYAPDLAAPVAILTSAPFGTYAFDYEKMAWQKRKDAPQKAVWNELYSTYVPPLKRHLISQRNDPFMWTYSPKTEEWAPLAEVPEPLRGCQALAYDSANNVVVAMVADRQSKEARKPILTWVMDPATMKWSAVKPSGEVPRGAASWAPLWYVPDHNAFFFLNRSGQTGCETWAYRYSRSRAPSETTGEGTMPQLMEPKGRVLFEERFQDLTAWRQEGAGKMVLDSDQAGTLRLECVGSGQGKVGTQAFCVKDFPDGIAVEYDLKVLTKNGLIITFVAMRGINGEDMFAPEMPKREGVFGDYVRNPRLRSYHVSVSRYGDTGEHTGVSNWRRNPGLNLMREGPDLCKEINRWYRIRIVKDGPHCQLGVNGVLAHEFTDPGELPTPMPDSGKIGFRAIGADVRALIRNVSVRSIR